MDWLVLVGCVLCQIMCFIAGALAGQRSNETRRQSDEVTRKIEEGKADSRARGFDDDSI